MAKEKLNDFLVHIYNLISVNEENELKKQLPIKKISIKEVHLLEALSELEKVALNTQKELAKVLYITSSSLSVSLKTLETKNLISRVASKEDGRIKFLYVTESGMAILKIHHRFHDKLAIFLNESLDSEQINVLEKALEIVKSFFMKGENYGY